MQKAYIIFLTFTKAGQNKTRRTFTSYFIYWSTKNPDKDWNEKKKS